MTANFSLLHGDAADSAAEIPDEAHWRDIIGQIGSEVGIPLSNALERVTTLAATGRIDRAGLRALRDEIERARRAGMIGQQLARFASGRIRQTPESISVTQMLRELLLQRGREATARHIELRHVLKPAEVHADVTLLHGLMQALLDWALETARSVIEIRLDVKPWPPYARLVCSIDHAAPEEEPQLAARMPQAATDSLAWRLVQQIAWTQSLLVERSVHDTGTVLTIEFPRTVTENIEGVSVVEIDQGFSVSENSKPLAGSHILIVAGNREVRSLAKEAVRQMGLLVDFVTSVEEAEVFCRDALPHAIVHEAVLANERFQMLRSSILAEVPNFVFIELDPEGSAVELSSDNSRRRAHVGRDAILESLPTALIYELSRLP
jgi:hypothetical protein